MVPSTTIKYFQKGEEMHIREERGTLLLDSNSHQLCRPSRNISLYWSVRRFADFNAPAWFLGELGAPRRPLQPQEIQNAKGKTERGKRKMGKMKQEKMRKNEGKKLNHEKRKRKEERANEGEWRAAKSNTAVIPQFLFDFVRIVNRSLGSKLTDRNKPQTD